MSKEQAEQYALSRRVFEDGCFYKCVYFGRNIVCRYKVNDGFMIIGDLDRRTRSDFDSIGEKITF